MKTKYKLYLIIFAAIITFTLLSCATTPITETAEQKEYKIILPGTEDFEQIGQMDFIGYKSNISLLSVAASHSGAAW